MRAADECQAPGGNLGTRRRRNNRPHSLPTPSDPRRHAAEPPDPRASSRMRSEAANGHSATARPPAGRLVPRSIARYLGILGCVRPLLVICCSKGTTPRRDRGGRTTQLAQCEIRASARARPGRAQRGAASSWNAPLTRTASAWNATLGGGEHRPMRPCHDCSRRPPPLGKRVGGRTRRSIGGRERREVQLEESPAPRSDPDQTWRSLPALSWQGTGGALALARQTLRWHHPGTVP